MTLDKIFKSLSNETRLRIINILQQCSECCVCDLEKILKESQPKISRHLAYLKQTQLVKDYRCNNMTIYSLEYSKTINKIIFNCVPSIFEQDPIFQMDAEQFNQLMRQGKLSRLDAEGNCSCYIRGKTGE